MFYNTSFPLLVSHFFQRYLFLFSIILPKVETTMTTKLAFVSIKPTARHTASVIFLHGLGDSGHGWSEVGQMLQPALPNVHWIFPHSPERPITVNGGARMPGWYDIVSLERISGQEDETGMMESKKLVQQLIEQELDKGIPNSRIILGRFSLVLAAKSSWGDLQFCQDIYLLAQSSLNGLKVPTRILLSLWRTEALIQLFSTLTAKTAPIIW